MTGFLNIPQTRTSADPLHGYVPAIFEHDIGMLDTDGLVTSWKSNIGQADDPASASLIGRHHSHLFTAEDQARGKPEQVLSLAHLNGGFQEESWRVRRDGSRYWASVVVEAVHDESGRVIGYATMMRDISETRALREALRRSEQRIGLIMSSIAHYAIFMLDVDGIVASWNQAAESTLGYAKRDIVGQHFSCFFPPEDRSGGRHALALNMARASGKYEDEGWRIRQDGSRFWARVVIDPIHDEYGECIGFVHVTRDITQQRTIDELEQQLFKAQTVEPLNKDVAHEFNDLLSAVTVSLDLITRSGDISRMHSLTRAAQRAAQAGATLTARLLAVHPQEGKLSADARDRQDIAPQGAGPRRSPAPAEGPVADADHGRDGNHTTVLVVEDDPDVLELASGAIEELGYEVRRAADAETALVILSNEPTIGLLFTDIVMSSSINGLSLARRAREINPALGVLLTSGYPRAQLPGFTELDEDLQFIPKPYRVSLLDEKLRGLTAAMGGSGLTCTGPCG